MSMRTQNRTESINKLEYNSIFNSKGEYIGYPIYQFNVDWVNDLGNPPTWTEATAQYETARSLCERCSKFDLKELFKRYDEGVKVTASEAFEISLGQIHAMIESDCDLCEFFVQVAAYIWRKARLPSDASCTLKRVEESSYDYTILSVDCTNTELPDFDRSTGVVKTKELTLWRDDPRDDKGELRICFRPDGTPGRSWKPLTMVAILAHACINQHPKCRQQADLGLQMKTQLFVISVDDFILIPAPQGCSYVALSYVWGPQTEDWQIRPIKSSTEKSVAMPESLPNTIIHAMNLAKQFGFKYIWVDQLCVPEDARDRQIAEMDLVYRNATLSLIAAVDNAESGIPGVGARNRRRDVPPVLEVGGVNIGIRTARLVSHALSEEAWDTRGWTYQEKVLSSRQIVFTEHEVFYKCLEGEKGEESCHKSNTIEFTRDSLFTWGELLSVAHGRVAWQIYGDCVGVYSKREFTFKSDILNAFEGIVGYFRQKYEWTFCWGLPDDNFALSLLWQSSNPVRRKIENISFPSWCWAGWIGTVDYSGFRPKEVDEAAKLPSYKDFIPVSWKTGMLEKAVQSGILVLDAECVDIDETNCDFFQGLVSGEGKQDPEVNQAIKGSIFLAIAAFADARSGTREGPPLVRGLVLKLEGTIAYRASTAHIDLEKWLGMPRELKSISLA